MSAQRYLLARALLPPGIAERVYVEVVDGRFAAVRELALAETPPVPTPLGQTSSPSLPVKPLPGLTIPGLANTHSHAFHRALRGRTHATTPNQTGNDDPAHSSQPSNVQPSNVQPSNFWRWRDQMYALALRLNPDTYYDLALATYQEMASVGITAVGEFHYLHHQPDGSPYADPNAMGQALIAAAHTAGIRIALLDTCYLSSGFGAPLSPAQRRFGDGSASAWAQRMAARSAPGAGDTVVFGAAIHSVRAVPKDALSMVASTAAGTPLHVHLSEQIVENHQCLAAYGRSPTQLLAEHNALGAQTTVVHATHLTTEDIKTLGEARCFVSFCPTTERDLGDGVGPSRELAQAGARLTLGSDSHAVLDLFEEMRAVELNERLIHQQRGIWPAEALLAAATSTGQASLGFADAGGIAVGQRADLVVVDDSSVRLAGTASVEGLVFAATGADVQAVMADGSWIFEGQREPLGLALAEAIAPLWQQSP